MQITEKLLMYINLATENLYEFADPANTLKGLIRDLAPIIIEHIYKIMYYGQRYNTTKRHWTSEIASSFLKFVFKKVKHPKKPLSTKDIKKAIVSKYIDSDEIIDIIYECNQQYQGVNIDSLDYDVVYNNIVNTLEPLIGYFKTTKNPDLDKIIQIIEEV